MKPKRSRTDWIIAGSALAVFALIASVTYLEKGLAAGTAFYVFAIVIQTKSETRKESLSERRFWAVIAILAVIHIVAISVIKFPELRAGLISLPFALVDGFVMWGLINWIEKHFPGSGVRSEP
jgi:choline-glycine betaine transporter